MPENTRGKRDGSGGTRNAEGDGRKEGHLSASAEATGGPTRRILVATRDPALVRRLERLLPGAAWRLVAAGDACTGLEALAASPFDTVIGDEALPGAGERFLAEVGRRFPEVRRLLLVGDEEPEASPAEQRLRKGTDDARLGLALAGRLPGSDLVEENRRLRAQILGLERRGRASDEWELTFEAIEDPIAVLSRDLRVQRGNRAYGRMAGVEGAALCGGLCHQLLFKSDSPCDGCPLGRGETPARPVELLAGDRSFAMSCFDAGDRLICSYRETTAERMMTRRMLQTEKLAAVGQLAAGIAHEINNPLGGILAFTQLMLRDEGRSAHDLEMLQEVEQAALRCKRIVGSLLNFSRRQHSGRSVFDVNRLAEEVSILFRPQLKGLARVGFHQQMWPVPLQVRGEANEIEQVILNLLVNALQALDAAGGTVTLTTREREGRVEIEVRDDGRGIAPEHLSRVFEPTFTTKPPGEGTGFGLATAWSIADRHGGSLEVRSEPGKGSTFILGLPSQAELGGSEIDPRGTPGG